MTTIKPDRELQKYLEALIKEAPYRTQHSLTGTIIACKEYTGMFGKENWVFYTTAY